MAGKTKIFMNVLNIVGGKIEFSSCMYGECKCKAYIVINASALLRSMKMKEA